GFDFYLRKGISPDPPHNIFLNAVGDSLSVPMDGLSLRKLLVSKLNLDTFLSLKSGALKLVFQDDNDPNDKKAFDRFLQYINENNYIDEDLVWDFITLPAV